MEESHRTHKEPVFGWLKAVLDELAWLSLGTLRVRRRRAGCATPRAVCERPV